MDIGGAFNKKPGASEINKAHKVEKSLNVRSRSRRSSSAFVCMLLLMAQMLMVGAAIAQTKEPQGGGQQQGNGGSQISPDGRQTQDTVPNPYIDAPGFVPVVNNSADVNVNGGAYNGGGTKGIDQNVNDLLRRDNPFGTAERQRTTLVFQSAEQLRNNPQQDVNNMLSNSLGSINDTYRGMHQWFNDDIIGNLFSQIGQLFGKWISELINGWIADTVQFLAAFLRVFVLNPNIAVNGLNGSQDDGISQYIRQGADVMYGIAVDLLLLLFILAIWKYWVEASWRGGGNLMGAVGRLIATAGLMLAFPTLYAFEIQITNEMIKAVYFNSSDQVMMLDSALASAVRGGILAGIGGLASAFAPLLGGALGGIIGGTVGEIFAFAGLVIFMILGGILIAELVYILVLKAIQTALLTAQYMFAPVFLVFFATPDTENVATGFVRAWVETSLWTFVWVGLLKIMVIIMFSDYNPWGKILLSVGVLQMMIQVPTFLARAQISPMSDFISAGLITGGLMKMFGAMGNIAKTRLGQAVSYMTNDKYAASGVPQTANPTLDNINRQSGNPDLVQSLKDASKTGRTPPGQTPGSGVPGVTPPGINSGGGATTPSTATNPAAGQQLNTPGAGTNGAPPPKTPVNPATGLNPATNPATASANTGVPLNPATNPAANPATNPAAANPATATGNTGVPLNPTATTPGNNPAGTNPPVPGVTAPGGGARTAATGAALAAGVGAGAAMAGAVGRGAGVTAPGLGAGGNPGMGSDPTWEEAKLGSGYYHNPGMYAVDAVRGIVGNIKTLSTRVQEGAQGNSIEGTTRSGAQVIKMRAGATDAEKAHVLMTAGLANQMQSDPAAMDAARRSAIEAGADGPQGFLEGAAANWLSYTGGTFKQTALAKGRFQRAMYQQAVKGAEDYIGGRQGNAYTEHLRGRYGAWTPDMDSTAVWLATDSDASESSWNPAIGPATDALSASGLAITGATRGAIQNPYVMTMRPGARKAAVRALLRACMYDSRMENVDPNSQTGGIMLGEIARSMPESFVQTAIAVDAVSGGRDLSPDNLQNIAQLSSELNVPPDAIYRSSALAGGWVAKGVTGNTRALGARNFDQIRRVINAQYANDPNPGRAQEVYQEVLMQTADRVRDMNTAGITTRMMTDPGFASDLHQFIDNSVPDMQNHDMVRSAIVGAGTVVRYMGTAGFTQQRANAVFRYIQDGNNASQLTGQDIVVTERLVGAGLQNMSQSHVQVTRNLPGMNAPGYAITQSDLSRIQDIAAHVDMGSCRPDQAIAVSNIMDAGGRVNRQTVEVAARLSRQPGGFDQGVFRVEAELLANDVVNNAGDAHMVFTNCLNSAATDAGVTTMGKAIPQIMSEIQGINPNFSMDTIQNQICDIQRRGGYDSRQLCNPVVFQAAYDASTMPTNQHRVASIQIAERIHGAAAVGNQDVLETYDTVLEAGVAPEQMNLQRYYAARALRDYKASAGVSMDRGPQPEMRVLDRIRQDSRFNMGGASVTNAPALDAGLWQDIVNMRQWP